MSENLSENSGLNFDSNLNQNSTQNPNLNQNFTQNQTSHFLAKPIPSSNFTNNTEPNTLKNKFSDILHDKGVVNLSFLVGYFRASGFKHLLEILGQDLARFKSIRILVGINVDEMLGQMLSNGDDIAFADDKKFHKIFKKSQRKLIAAAPYSKEVEDSVNALKIALESKSLQIRIIKDKNVHAKFYVFSHEPTPQKTQPGAYRFNGSLIVGSSNLSHNGWVQNYEYNLATQDSDDIQNALFEFNALWSQSVEIQAQDIAKLTKKTYLEPLSIKTLYHKLLLEYFGEDSLRQDYSIEGLFGDFKPLLYQIDAVSDGLSKIKKYNGFFLSDVVGLGKTLIASVIAKKLVRENLIEGNILVSCPPSLQSSWREHFSKIDIGTSRFTITTHDKLDKIDAAARYELLIIDESHRFRNQNADRYKALQNISKAPFKSSLNSQLRRKKLILISATPQNNSPEDIKNQLLLFQDAKDCNIGAVVDLEGFFNEIINRYNEIKKQLEKLSTALEIYNEKLEKINDIFQAPSEITKIHDKIKEIQAKIAELKAKRKALSSEIRENILRFVMLRRTRADIELYYKDDLNERKVVFPTIHEPKEISYTLEKDTFKLAENTLYLINAMPNSIGDYGYYRYLIFPNLTALGRQKFILEYGKKYQDERYFNNTAQRLRGLVVTLLFKRFESSFEAFKSTLKAQIRSINAFILMFERGEIHVPKNNFADLNKFYDLVESGNDEGLAEFLEGKEKNIFKLDAEDFLPEYKQNLQNDLKTMQNLLAKWQKIELDSKFEKFEKFLDSQKDKKIIIFTEATTTAKYLHERLKTSRKDILQIDGQNRDKFAKQVRENFDANFAKEKQKNDINILISTDTLAEGINLHRSNIVLNYDSPWNATLLMQRIGRINRIGTEFADIFIYNFKPSKLGDIILKLNTQILQKLQSFHDTLGEDSAIYDENEEVSSQELFSKVKQNLDEYDAEISYKKELKELYNNHREYFESLKKIALKSRTFIPSDNEKCFAFIRQSRKDSKDSYFYTLQKGENLGFEAVQDSDFIAMAEFLRANFNTPKFSLNESQISKHYADINTILSHHKAKLNPQNVPLKAVKFSQKTKKAIVKLQNLPTQMLYETERKILIEALQIGSHTATLANEILAANSKDEFLKIIQDKNLQSPTKQSKKKDFKEPEICLSVSVVNSQER